MSGEEISALEFDIQHIYFSRRDFQKASQFLSAAFACDNNVVREALLTSAIISYARPFSQTAFRRFGASTNFLSELVRTKLSDASKSLHAQALTLGKRAVSGSFAEAAPVELEASRRGRSLRMMFTPQRSCPGNWTILKEELDLPAFRQVADELYQRCGQYLLDLSGQLADAQPMISRDDLHALVHEEDAVI